MTKNRYDNFVGRLHRFALTRIRALITIYINNQIFSFKALYILKFSIYFIRNIIILY